MLTTKTVPLKNKSNIKIDVVASPFRNVVQISNIGNQPIEHIKTILEKKEYGKLAVNEVQQIKDKAYAILNSENGL